MISLGAGGRLCPAVRAGVRCPSLAETVQREQKELHLDQQQQQQQQQPPPPPPQSPESRGYSPGRVRPAPGGFGSPRNVPGAPRALTLQPPPPWAPACSLRRAR
ncbi:POU domain, class 6, transcription factor 2-like [Psammomys obesus]|uniref:POU domain, class 6, transcription factor 2-like n=1 Tax=Psammomys obesus TaxID=48139 RepID=UPI002452E542|nr:POU domain, class 6, transcription factor 2-like [Psammomys obesus]